MATNMDGQCNWKNNCTEKIICTKAKCQIVLKWNERPQRLDVTFLYIEHKTPNFSEQDTRMSYSNFGQLASCYCKTIFSLRVYANIEYFNQMVFVDLFDWICGFFIWKDELIQWFARDSTTEKWMAFIANYLVCLYVFFFMGKVNKRGDKCQDVHGSVFQRMNGHKDIHTT